MLNLQDFVILWAAGLGIALGYILLSASIRR